MHLTFLGTGAGAPSLQRNVTSIALTLTARGDTWLFDCGEGTQRQFMRASLKPSRLEKIFITHLHGDHIFGLPGLLTSRSMAGINAPLTLYGPVGLKVFIETSLKISGSWLDCPVEIIEIEEGMIYQDEQHVVQACWLNHVVPCLGYRVDQRDRLGKLNDQRLRLEKIPAGIWLQDLKRGNDITLADGRRLIAKEYLGQGTKGKSVAILGDTAPCQQAKALVQGVDLLVHEATLQAGLEEKANGRGHSTTVQAAQLAREAEVKQLVATHFSARYRSQDMPALLAECQAVFAATTLASDFAEMNL